MQDRLINVFFKLSLFYKLCHVISASSKGPCSVIGWHMVCSPRTFLASSGS